LGRLRALLYMLLIINVYKIVLEFPLPITSLMEKEKTIMCEATEVVANYNMALIFSLN